MSSTLIIGIGDERFDFGLPVKAYLARDFYDHDGSLGGDLRFINTQDLRQSVEKAMTDPRVARLPQAERLLSALNEDIAPDYATLEWET